MPEQLSVGIVGASGFTGAELLRLLVNHPNMRVRAVTGDSQAGTKVADLYPSLGPAYGDMAYVKYEDAGLDELDLVFAGLPHRASQEIVGGLVDTVDHVIDLSADFRLNDPATAAAGRADQSRWDHHRCRERRFRRRSGTETEHDVLLGR